MCWLLAESPPGQDEPAKYWLSTLPTDTALPKLVRLAEIRWRVEHDYRELKPLSGCPISKGAPGSACTTSPWSPPRTPSAHWSGSRPHPATTYQVVADLQALLAAQA
ncbi:hypothetical protein [Actinomadura rugatobispora]|uniref:Transposase IS4-like domain-containing protein n=1 Tax=Actinomadura rugatobispora TaxID=1994 RepID=A0ABW0ZN64_9ACTN